MRLKLFFLSIILLTYSQILFAIGEGKIVGQVFDGETNRPLAGCNILIEGTQLGAAADEDGYFMVLNVPPGTYDISAEMIGYVKDVKQGVKVISDRTVKIEFMPKPEVLTGETITVEAFRNPLVQKDLTYKIQAVTSKEMENLPVNTMTDILLQQAGISRNIVTAPISSLPVFGQFATVPTDNIHFRGGRVNEALYLFDGVNVTDGLWGGYSLDPLGEYALSSIEAFTGTFGAKYGNAMSGVVNIAAYDQIDVKPRFRLQAATDNLVQNWSNNTTRIEAFVSAALPFYTDLGIIASYRYFTTDGYINGYLYPNYVNSEGQDKSGTPEEVPMQYNDTEFLFGKMIWKPLTNIKALVGGYITKSNQGLYNHFFKYNPYGTPRVNLEDRLLYGKLNIILNDKSYLWLTVANYDRKFVSRVWDNPDNYLVVPQNSTAEFSTSGEDWVYFDTRFQRYEARADFFYQINTIHSLTAGTDYNQLDASLQRRNPDGFSVIEDYKYKPVEIHSYISDKMEFEEMGMVVNVGLRLDYIDPKREVLKNRAEITNLEAELVAAEPKTYVTPRLGVSFPIMETAAMWFGYGHYYQYPNYYKVFQGTFYAEALGQYRPNPQVENSPIANNKFEPEKTVNYEVGIQSKLSETIAFDITGFYRKTSNLTGVLLSETTEGKRFQVLGNLDYATVKGLEFALRKNFTDNFSLVLNYTLTQTLVSTSVLFALPTDEALTFPAEWDQPHQFNGVLNFSWPSGWGFSMWGYISSGTPYTRTSFNPNGERGPLLNSLDLTVFKNFDFMGMGQRLYFQVNNLFNKTNVWWVYSDSGIAGQDANPATSYDYTNNPAMYGPGRIVQFGIKLWN
jgi:outer membrane receptor protein involved in Fe transport